MTLQKVDRTTIVHLWLTEDPAWIYQARSSWLILSRKILPNLPDQKSKKLTASPEEYVNRISYSIPALKEILLCIMELGS